MNPAIMKIRIAAPPPMPPPSCPNAGLNGA
jgi:hypothetical protein